MYFISVVYFYQCLPTIDSLLLATDYAINKMHWIITISSSLTSLQWRRYLVGSSKHGGSASFMVSVEIVCYTSEKLLHAMNRIWTHNHPRVMRPELTTLYTYVMLRRCISYSRYEAWTTVSVMKPLFISGVAAIKLFRTEDASLTYRQNGRQNVRTVIKAFEIRKCIISK